MCVVVGVWLGVLHTCETRLFLFFVEADGTRAFLGRWMLRDFETRRRRFIPFGCVKTNNAPLVQSCSKVRPRRSR